MGAKWKLTIKTSLPNVCYGEQDLKTSVFWFDDFETARDALRAKLKEYAFSFDNDMFDGFGNLIYMKKYMTMIQEEDVLFDEMRPEWFCGKMAVTLLDILRYICRGQDVNFPYEYGPCSNADIEAVFYRDLVTVCGTEEGAFNGYAPKIDTNMMTMEKPQNYHLYIDDMFGQGNWMQASSELYMDLTMELDQLAFPV